MPAVHFGFPTAVREDTLAAKTCIIKPLEGKVHAYRVADPANRLRMCMSRKPRINGGSLGSHQLPLSLRQQGSLRGARLASLTTV